MLMKFRIAAFKLNSGVKTPIAKIKENYIFESTSELFGIVYVF